MLAALLTNLEVAPAPIFIPVSSGNPGGDELWRPRPKHPVHRDEMEDIVALVIALAEASGP